MNKIMHAQCLCGTTQFDVDLVNYQVLVCHCSLCRRQSSGLLMTIDVKPESLVFLKQDQLGVFKSSEWEERGFCKQCGTTLFWRMQDHSYCNINVFALDELPKELSLDMEIYIDNKPDFYSLSQPTKKLTEAEVVAMFNP